MDTCLSNKFKYSNIRLIWSGKPVDAPTGLSDCSVGDSVLHIAEGTGKSFTLQLNQGAKAGDTITLAANGLGSYTKVHLGDTPGIIQIR